MERVGVWSGEETLVRQLQSRLGNRWGFLWGTHPADFAQTTLPLLIIAPSATGLAGAGLLRPRLALLPGGDPALARAVRAASAVSYGLGRQNTLTFSSLDAGAVSLALQREVFTVEGDKVERQEWVLPYDRTLRTPEEFLCLAGALLLLGQRLG